MHQLLLAVSAVSACASDEEHRIDKPGVPIVCDPLPPPITCTIDGNIANQTAYIGDERFYVAAKWTAVGSALVARVRISFNLYSYESRRDAALAFSGDPRLTGAGVSRVDRQATAIEFDCVPDAGATTVAVFVPMTCDAKAACYRLELDVRQPQAETRVPFTVIKTGC